MWVKHSYTVNVTAHKCLKLKKCFWSHSCFRSEITCEFIRKKKEHIFKHCRHKQSYIYAEASKYFFLSYFFHTYPVAVRRNVKKGCIVKYPISYSFIHYCETMNHNQWCWVMNVVEIPEMMLLLETMWTLDSLSQQQTRFTFTRWGRNYCVQWNSNYSRIV